MNKLYHNKNKIIEWKYGIMYVLLPIMLLATDMGVFTSRSDMTAPYLLLSSIIAESNSITPFKLRKQVLDSKIGTLID